MNYLSKRITELIEPQTLAMARKSRELQSKGIDIINLSLGEPDFNTPDIIKEAAKKAIDENYSRYMPVAGYADLREAICRKFKRDNNLIYTPDQIVVSTGAKQSVANAILCLLDPGDEALVPSPYWVTYIELIKFAGAVPVVVPAGIETNFKVTTAQLSKHITPKTKLMIFSSPCNPSGSVYSKDELREMAELFFKHKKVCIISDEIYEHINFTGKHESIAQFDNIRDRVVVVNGVSKGFAMTGWRIGYIGASLEIARACDKMQGQFTSGASSIAQKAAKEAVSVLPEQAGVPEMRNAFRRRRDLALKLLNDIPGLKANVPDGAFYIFPDVSYYFGKKLNNGVIKDATELTMYLLMHANVALVTGDAFGDSNCIRISYAASEEKISEAMNRIKKALEDLVN